MNLYIWHNPYSVSYGMSLCIVAAESLEEAKRKAAKGKRYRHGYDQKQPDHSWARWAAEKLGEPDRVLTGSDIKAEWHEWSE